MTIRKPENRKRFVNLDGPDGNAFVLMGMARRFCFELDLNADVVLERMQSGDYTNLVFEFEQLFGSFIDIETSDMDLIAGIERLKAQTGLA